MAASSHVLIQARTACSTLMSGSRLCEEEQAYSAELCEHHLLSTCNKEEICTSSHIQNKELTYYIIDKHSNSQCFLSLLGWGSGCAKKWINFQCFLSVEGREKGIGKTKTEENKIHTANNSSCKVIWDERFRSPRGCGNKGVMNLKLVLSIKSKMENSSTDTAYSQEPGKTFEIAWRGVGRERRTMTNSPTDHHKCMDKSKLRD